MVVWVLMCDAAYVPPEGVIEPPGFGSAAGHFFPLLVYLPACLMIVVAVVRRRWPPAEDQGELLLKLALAGLAGAVSTTVAVIDSRLTGVVAPVEIWLGAVATLLAAAALWLGSGALPRGPATAFLGASFGVGAAALLLALAVHREGQATFRGI